MYDGIDFKTYSCNNHYINGVAGIAWHSEIDIANSDNGVIANTQFNWGSLLYGSQNKLGCWEDSPINSYTDANGSNIDPRSSVNEPYMEKYMSATRVVKIVPETVTGKSYAAPEKEPHGCGGHR